jgi:large conductance mechanosensitive channel
MSYNTFVSLRIFRVPEEEKKKEVTKKEVTIALPVVKAPNWLQGFVDFVREQGVVGLAVGLTIGVAAKSLIDSFVNNIFNPIVGIFTGGQALNHKTLCILHSTGGACRTSLSYGQFLSDLISFFIVALAVYFLVKSLKLDRIDVKNS